MKRRHQRRACERQGKRIRAQGSPFTCKWVEPRSKKERLYPDEVQILWIRRPAPIGPLGQISTWYGGQDISWRPETYARFSS